MLATFFMALALAVAVSGPVAVKTALHDALQNCTPERLALVIRNSR